jgi:RNA polymerase sigma-70 factor (ECF subfamily)
VFAARDRADPASRKAMEVLCTTYWYPVYAYIRRSCQSHEDSHDLTQGFFSTILSEGFLDNVSPENGKFRAYLLACCRHYLQDERRRERARKRGGGRLPLSLSRDEAERRFNDEPSHALTPERLFERRWALEVLSRSIEALKQEMDRKGKQALFARLRSTLSGQEPVEPYAQIGAELGLSEGAVKVHVHRLRKRYGEVLREEIGRTLADPALIEDEIRDLFAALAVPQSESRSSL